MSCKYCGIDLSGRELGSHIWSCKKNPAKDELIKKRAEGKAKKWKFFDVNCHCCKKIIQVKEWNVDSPKREKYFCSRSCANKRERSQETKDKIAKSLQKEKILHFCTNCNAEIGKNKHKLCKKCLTTSSEYKKNLSESLKGKSGGYRKGGGRGKSQWYNGDHYDSQFEVDYAKLLESKGVKFKRNTKRFYFEWEGRKTYYIPDFLLIEENRYIELKGFWHSNKEERFLEAIKVNKIQVEVIMHKSFYK